MADGKIVIDTKIDTSGLDKGINDIDKKLKGVKGANFDGLKNAFAGATKDASLFGVKLGDISSAMGSGAGMAGLLGGAVGALASAFIDLAMQAIQMAIQAMGEFIKKGVELASSIQESMNVINVTFGDTEVAEWATELGSSFNVATDEALRFAGTFGTIAKQMTNDEKAIKDISKTLTALSGDMASFYNTSNEEAFNALRAGLTGEMEQLKKFNVFLSEANLNQYALSLGMDKTVKTMTEQEKQLLRLNYIMEQTKDVQGDAIRTQDSYANATKQLELSINNASTALGDEMLPSLTSLKNVIGDFFTDNVEVFKLIGNVFGVIIDALAVVGELSSLVLKTMGLDFNTIAQVINVVIDSFDWLIDNLKTFLEWMNGGTKKETDAMAVYMEDFSSVAVKSMEEVAESTGNAFEDARKEIEGELGVISKALDDYYKDDLRNYRKALEEKYGDSKGAYIKIEQEMKKREEYNDRMMKKDLENEEKKLKNVKLTEAVRLDAMKAQEEAMKRQTQVAEQEAKKQMGFWENLKKSWDNMFGGVGSKTVSFGTGYNTVNRSVSTYSNSRSTSNTFNMNLYGADFMTALDQAQMIARLRG